MNSTPGILIPILTSEQLKHKQQLMKVLSKHMPSKAVEYCSELVMIYKLHVHIEVERKDRLGDYSPHLGKGNRISINHNLNPYNFLITFIHELAHHTAYKKYGNKHQPHGPEWKEEFKTHMRRLVMMRVFPTDIEVPLIAHMKKPAYTHSGDVALMKALNKYDKQTYLIVDDLKKGDLFKTSANSKIIMQLGDKRRVNYFCTDIRTGKLYLVHGIAKVYPVQKEE